jgi:hypothetical protein
MLSGCINNMYRCEFIERIIAIVHRIESEILCQSKLCFDTPTLVVGQHNVMKRLATVGAGETAQ